MNESIQPPEAPVQEETQEEKIERLLARMDLDERHSRGKSLDQQRMEWQHTRGLRYIIGPFLLGQLFDLWQWTLGRVDRFLWGWAEQSTPAPPSEPADPRASLRKALKNKR